MPFGILISIHLLFLFISISFNINLIISIIKFWSVKYALKVLLDANEFTRNNPNIWFHVQRIHRTAHLATSIQNFLKSVCQRTTFLFDGAKVVGGYELYVRKFAYSPKFVLIFSIISFFMLCGSNTSKSFPKDMSSRINS